jgi:CheY-like chemotaxis protein
VANNGKNNPLKPILLVEDNDDDVDLILHAFKKTNLANEVVVARDGQQALDFFAGRAPIQTGPRSIRAWSCWI